MKLGIMQPYFFPYLGHFALLNYIDKWVVFDSVQYIYHGWINRNRILHPSGEKWQYITVPLAKHARNTPIKDIAISSTFDWKSRILGQLLHYKRTAPFYKETMAVIEECFSSDIDHISKLNVSILKLVCITLNIKFDYNIYSEMNISPEGEPEPGDWALQISEKLHADEYVNPAGGKEIFEKNKFAEKGIKLSFLSLNNVIYNQFNGSFIPGLSIIDVMMFNDTPAIQKYLNNLEISE